MPNNKGNARHKDETLIRVALYARNERYARPGRFTTGPDVIDAARNVIIENGWPKRPPQAIGYRRAAQWT